MGNTKSSDESPDRTTAGEDQITEEPTQRLTKCEECQRTLASSAFSANQRKKNSNKRRCSDCTAASQDEVARDRVDETIGCRVKIVNLLNKCDFNEQKGTVI